MTARPRIVCLCGSTRFYDAFQQANYDRTMAGEIVLSVGFYPHAKAEHGHGEGVGHDSVEKVTLDELHKRKIDLADYVLVVSDEAGYFGNSTLGEIEYAVAHGKPVEFAVDAARSRWMVAAATAPAGGGSRPVPAQDDGGGIPGSPPATGAFRASRVTMTVTDPGKDITRRQR